ncbi:UDP-N-acetylglucosamine transporter yea4 [Penicillium macrosclerotiorum]|uniref:UDP-N-acetylglucosamine transporter yea4 n=1 Tax=Penicillium macrosclerotiorum TaxID=303699 RepID=UPI002548FF57|nr:UDP-N-acetylglucosamine transporter yea4 [Penicillium macrosclerotiorum]KAJ5689785.1 UDP-N-acetylglucosamine transporter yea4 [Penicillium macrosclerotiorum]
MIHDSDTLKRSPDKYVLPPTSPSIGSTILDDRDVLVATAGRRSSNKANEATKERNTSVIAAAAHAAVPTWANMVLMSSLIFGGCCANVFALEAIIKEQPTAGPLITFAQFVLCAVFTLPHFLSFSAGPCALFLSPRAIPLRAWLIYTGFFVTVNVLNNWAFAYKISVPLHIILRSGGPVASMIVGYITNGRRYSRGQILAVAMLTAGVVAAALADAQAKGQPIEIGSGEDVAMMTTATGFTILALAMILSAFQGIYADRLYATYGRDHWKEALFYSHSLSLPLFLTNYPQMLSQWRVVSNTPPLLSLVIPETGFVAHSAAASSSGLSFSAVSSTVLSISTVAQQSIAIKSILGKIPIQVAYLLMNALTQYVCIRGVHLLSAKSSSLTVTVVLNIRKLVSLLLSIYLFGNHLSPGVLVGAVLVFIGGGLYGFEGARLRRSSKKKKAQ